MKLGNSENVATFLTMFIIFFISGLVTCANYVVAHFDFFKEFEKVDFELEKCTTRTTIRAVKQKKKKKER